MGVADTLIPTKFIFIITHLLSTIVILSANVPVFLFPHLNSSISNKISMRLLDLKSQSVLMPMMAHIQGNKIIMTGNNLVRIIAACVITIIFLAFELIFLFLGYTLFYDRLNLFRMFSYEVMK